MTSARGLDDADVALADISLEKINKTEKRPRSQISGSITSLEAEFDEVHAGLEFPTEEERKSLRRVSDTLPWAAYRSYLLCASRDGMLTKLPRCFVVIAVVEMAERFSFYGSTVLFGNFIQWPLPEGSHTGAGGPSDEGQSGVLGMGQQASTGILTFYQFWQVVSSHSVSHYLTLA